MEFQTWLPSPPHQADHASYAMCLNHTHRTSAFPALRPSFSWKNEKILSFSPAEPPPGSSEAWNNSSPAVMSLAGPSCFF